MKKSAIYQIYHVFQQPHSQGLSSHTPAREMEIGRRLEFQWFQNLYGNCRNRSVHSF